MSRADRIAQRQAERERWRKLHGYACPVCGVDLDDDDLTPGVNPREPRACAEHCGELVDLEAL
jgi:hypothetical protein